MKRCMPETLNKYLVPYCQYTIEVFKLDDEKALREWAEKQMLVPFKLVNSDLFYFAVLKLKDAAFLFLKLHHIISDAASYTILARQIIKLYTEMQQNRAVSEINASSYLAYVKEELIYEKFEQYLTDKQFWQQLFSDLPKEACLSYKKGSNCVKSRQIFKVPDQFGTIAKEFCEKFQVTKI